MGGPAARQWLTLLEPIAVAEEAARPGSRRLLRTVAENAYKLFAYKDEYEVARLMLDAETTGAAREIGGPRGRLAWQLHPPLLRALGLRGKISIGIWAKPLILLLAAARVLRGTAFDPFGVARLRRIERALPGEYVAVLDRVMEELSETTFEAIIRLAALPDQVRGYEELKLRRVEAYREALAAAENELHAPSHPPLHVT